MSNPFLHSAIQLAQRAALGALLGYGASELAVLHATLLSSPEDQPKKGWRGWWKGDAKKLKEIRDIRSRCVVTGACSMMIASYLWE